MDTTAPYYWFDDDVGSPTLVDPADERIVGCIIERPSGVFATFDEDGKALGRFVSLERARREVQASLRLAPAGTPDPGGLSDEEMRDAFSR